jgi:mono/diheme cytochrome c family protein
MAPNVMLASLLAVGLAGCASLTPMVDASRPDPAAERGRDFAMRRCAGCHTVGLDDGGAQDGPSFRSLALRYNAISLQRHFAEVSEHGFDRMPPVSFTRSEAEDLIAYLQTLRP